MTYFADFDFSHPALWDDILEEEAEIKRERKAKKKAGKAGKASVIVSRWSEADSF